MVRKTPQWWAKLGDFGITKRIDSEHTALRTRVGTPRYLAPEVEDDDLCDCEYTNAVDLWSLGCVLYHMLAQEPPFKTTSSKKKPFPEEKLKTRASDDAIAFIRLLLSKTPADRPTAQDALMDKWFMTASDNLTRRSSLPARVAVASNTEANHASNQDNNVPEVKEKGVDSDDNITRRPLSAFRPAATFDAEVNHKMDQDSMTPEVQAMKTNMRDTVDDHKAKRPTSLLKTASSPSLEVAKSPTPLVRDHGNEMNPTPILREVRRNVLQDDIDHFTVVPSRTKSAEPSHSQNRERKDWVQGVVADLRGREDFLGETSERTMDTSFPSLEDFKGMVSDGTTIPPRNAILSSVRTITIKMEDNVEMPDLFLSFPAQTRMTAAMTVHELYTIPVCRYSERRDKNSNVIEFKSKVVSREHCVITFRSQKWWIKDVGSSSGTFLNGDRLSLPGLESKHVELKHLSSVQLGLPVQRATRHDERPVRMRICLD